MSDPRITFASSVGARDTSEVRQLLTNTAVHIVVPEGVLCTFTGQVLTYQIATLLGRLFDLIILDGDEQITTHSSFTLLTGPFIPNLHSYLQALRPIQAAQPSINDVFVVIGSGAKQSGTIYLGSTAWSAKFSRHSPQSVEDTQNSVGAIAAGILGAAEVFKTVFNNRLEKAVMKDSYRLSLINYGLSGTEEDEPVLPSHIDLNGVLFGCGSIGCGVVGHLLLSPSLNGTLTLVDNGRFDERNPFKYSFLDWETASS
ncbi:MAG: E2 ligase fold family C protein, partial [Nitrososphaerota archaeon]|nr:E2 ligase fold family C protein [Nitrososphaerota archaeon]